MLHRDPAALLSPRRPRMWSLTSPLMADRLAPILTMFIVISRISSCSVCSSPFFGCFERWDTLNSHNCNNKMQQPHAKHAEYVSKELLNLWFGEGWRMTLRFNRWLAERSTNWFVSLGWWCSQLCWLVWRVWSLEVCFQCWEQGDMVIHFFQYACSHFPSRPEIALNLLHVMYMCLMGCSRD